MSKNKQPAPAAPKEPGLLISLVPIFSVFILLLLALIKYDVDIQIPLIIASVISGLISALVLKNPWKDIEKGIIDSITNAMQAILIACIIGLIIGSWISGGIVPSIIYYGLKILSPEILSRYVPDSMFRDQHIHGQLLDHRRHTGRGHGRHRDQHGHPRSCHRRMRGLRGVLRRQDVAFFRHY